MFINLIEMVSLIICVAIFYIYGRRNLILNNLFTSYNVEELNLLWLSAYKFDMKFDGHQNECNVYSVTPL